MIWEAGGVVRSCQWKSVVHWTLEGEAKTWQAQTCGGEREEEEEASFSAAPVFETAYLLLLWHFG